jgi:hypothetical protein
LEGFSKSSYAKIDVGENDDDDETVVVMTGAAAAALLAFMEGYKTSVVICLEPSE